MSVYKVGAPAGALKKNRFEFEIDGEILSVPKVEFMPAEGEDYIKEAIKDEQMSKRDYAIGLFTAVDAEVGAKIAAARLDRAQLGDLFDAWMAAGKTEPGKS